MDKCKTCSHNLDKNGLDCDRLCAGVSETDGNGVVYACEDYEAALYAAGINIIQSDPTVDAVPVVHGRWIEDGDTQTCSNCGEEHEWGAYRASYCPHCVARMDQEEENGK